MNTGFAFTFTCLLVYATALPILDQRLGTQQVIDARVGDNLVVLPSEKFNDDTEELWNYSYPPFNQENRPKSDVIEGKSAAKTKWSPPEKLPAYVMGVLKSDEVSSMLRELPKNDENPKNGKTLVTQDDKWVWKS